MPARYRYFPDPSYSSHTHALYYHNFRLNNSELGGSNIEGIDIGGQPRESLLGAVRSDERVNLDGGDIVLLLESGGDLALVGLDVDDEDQGVVLLNLLHGRLGVKRVDEDLASIEAGLVRDRLAGVLGRAAATPLAFLVCGIGQ